MTLRELREALGLTIKKAATLARVSKTCALRTEAGLYHPDGENYKTFLALKALARPDIAEEARALRLEILATSSPPSPRRAPKAEALSRAGSRAGMSHMALLLVTLSAWGR